MSDLYNTALGKNTLVAKPTSNLGTRELTFMCLAADADYWNNGNYSESNSDYAKAVQAIQLSAELFFLGAPSASVPDSFVFAIAVNTTDPLYYEGDYTDNVENSEKYEPNYLGYVLDELYNGAFTLYRLNARGAIIQ